MKVGRFYGIDVHIHWTFWLLIFFYLFAAAKSGGSLSEGIAAIAFVMAVFFCVLLHEYGHALAARRFGIRTQDITLMPIGGLARLERMPEKPVQELIVAIAGPAVNLVIAGVLLIFVALDVATGWAAPTVDVGTTFFGQLMAVNIILVLFNMLPAFPMDGGRVLRSLLAMKLGFLRATEVAARLGRWMALAFAIWGLVIQWNPMLVLLAVFIFITGTIELFQVKLRSMQNRAAEPFGPGSSWSSTDRNSTDSQHKSEERTASSPAKSGSDIIDAVDFRQIR